MIESASRHDGGGPIETDLCVIGSGPAGLSVAHEFLGCDTRVVVVESGGRRPRHDAQALNHGEVAGAPHKGLLEGRIRAFGGTTWTWAGQCLPLEPEAFTPREWVPFSGWPLAAEDLEPYYVRGARFLRVPPGALERDVWTQKRMVVPRFDDGLLGRRFSVFTRRPGIGTSYLPAFRRSRSVTALLGATAVYLHLSPDGSSVAQAELRTSAGHAISLRARAFVLAGGAYENPRLLMVSDDLAERLPALGRFFHDHPAAACATVRPTGTDLHDLFGVLRLRGVRYSPRLRLSPVRQGETRTLTCDAQLVWDSPEGLAALRRLPGELRDPRALATDSMRALRDVRGFASGARRRARGLSSAPAGAALRLVVMPEQAPGEANRIRLSRAVDRFGSPQVSVDWRPGEPERRTMQVMVQAVADEFRRLRLGEVEPAEWLTQPERWLSQTYDTFHQMGTTRMASHPSHGVVDQDCRVHGLRNVFVAGGSVFPTGGAANPTLTISALAIRLADHLKTGGLLR